MNIHCGLINLYGLLALIRSTVTKKPLKICKVLESLRNPTAAGVSNDVTSIGTVEFILIDIFIRVAYLVSKPAVYPA